MDNFFRTMLEYWFQKKNMAPSTTFWFRKLKSEGVKLLVCHVAIYSNKTDAFVIIAKFWTHLDKYHDDDQIERNAENVHDGRTSWKVKVTWL